jgi:Ni/Co efflux regulator RcnB
MTYRTATFRTARSQATRVLSAFAVCALFLGASATVHADNRHDSHREQDRGRDHRGASNQHQRNGDHRGERSSRHHNEHANHRDDRRERQVHNDYRRDDRQAHNDYRGNDRGRTDRYRGRDDRRAHDRHDWNRRDVHYTHPEYRGYRPHYAPQRHYTRPVVRYHAGSYYRPYQYRAYAWHRGDRMPAYYYGPRYIVHDYDAYRLYSPPRGAYWVRVDNDVVLTAVATGVVLAVVNDIFY